MAVVGSSICAGAMADYTDLSYTAVDNILVNSLCLATLIMVKVV